MKMAQFLWEVVTQISQMIHNGLQQKSIYLFFFKCEGPGGVKSQGRGAEGSQLQGWDCHHSLASLSPSVARSPHKRRPSCESLNCSQQYLKMVKMGLKWKVTIYSSVLLLRGKVCFILVILSIALKICLNMKI